MNIIMLNLIGVAVMVLIVWWFWLSKPKVVTVLPKGTIEIRVKNGVYDPAQIQVKLNEAVILRFIREDASPCADRVIFPALNISKNLSLHGTTDIQLLPQKVGEYEFSCQMGMYRGKLLVTV